MAGAGKCTQPGCPQASFREGFCIDHFRLAGKGSAGKLLTPALADEKVDDAMRAKFRDITKKDYNGQAKWYLNAYWADGGNDQAEEVWTIAHAFMVLDPKKKKGNELDPVLSSHYLQGLGKAMTALELKEELRRIDVDANGLMALMEYLLFKFRRLVSACINNPQGSLNPADQKELDEAQAKVDQVSAAEAEARAADADLKRQQDEYNGKVRELETKSKNESLGQVARNKAASELAQLRAQDPLPLRRAKITQEAAVRRLEQALKEATRILEEIKKRGTAPMGTMWWLQREITEANKYKPRSRQ